jgi:tRNA 2-thiouridine synthesizing protein A
MAKKMDLDARGFKCPTPTLMMSKALMTKQVEPGDTLSVQADCPTFEADVRSWCEKMKKVLIVFKDDAGVKKAEIRI